MAAAIGSSRTRRRRRSPMTGRSPRASCSAAGSPAAPRPAIRSGLMLPNSVGAALAFLALQATGRVPAMLNHTAGIDGVLSACRTAGLRRVVTSRRFVELAKLDALAERLAGEVELVWLEDVRAKLGVVDKLYGAVALRFAAPLHRRLGISPSDPAAVLFTSGSEGAPKGVVLSHANLLANRRQIAARVDFSPADLALNALPMFHSFGLTGGFLLPLLSGVRVFLYPSPLHYRIVPEIAYATGATILFGTDTFLAGYARRANPYDFYALRYVFAGAEPVREETREAMVRAVRQAHPRRLRRHRMLAGHRGQHADALPRRHGRPVSAAGRAPARAGSRDRRGRPPDRARPECDGRLSARRRHRRAAGRMVRHRRHRHRRRRGLRDDRRPRQALRQARRRDGLARRRRAHRRDGGARTPGTRSSRCPIRAAARSWSW